MKYISRTFILLFATFQFATGQTEVTLEGCQQLARENYPNLKKKAIFSEITALKQENIRTNYLPIVNLNGQATYQSDVPKINLDIPSINIPTVSKGQYKAYLEFQQSIWDGGINQSMQLVETAALAANISELEIEFFKLEGQVNKAWFSALLSKKSKKIYEAQVEVIREKQKLLESGIKNGVIEQSNLDILLAEEQQIIQNILEVEAGYGASLKVLSILTGTSIGETTKLKTTENRLDATNGLKRPELAFFGDQSQLLDANAELIEKQRHPQVFGFGQAGVGEPGLNMLNNDFDSFYLVGVGLKWKVFDWKKTKRDKMILQMQKDAVKAQEETFNQSIQVLLEQQLSTIQKIEKLLQSDTKIVSLREKVAKNAASKLENGTITSADYITELNAELVAKLRLETHKLQLQEAKNNYNYIKGI